MYSLLDGHRPAPLWSEQDISRLIETAKTLPHPCGLPPIRHCPAVGRVRHASRRGDRRAKDPPPRLSTSALGTLTVAQQRTSANYVTVVTKPKEKSQRQLLIAPATVAALRGHRQRQIEERLVAGSGWTNSGYVFVDEVGVEYHPQRFTKMFEAVVAETGAPKIRLHDTRHTMATLALEAGVHPKVVQEQLGHSAIAVTMDTYSHVPQAVKRDSAEKIASLYGGNQ